MTPNCMAFVARAVKQYSVKGDVLEVGSYDVNGSIRPIFADRKRFPSYLGVDMRPGPGVDRIALASNLPFTAPSFDCVVTTEMLEHDARFWISVQEFHRVLRPGGYLLVTTRNIGFQRHDYPSDFWRFTSDGLKQVLEMAQFEVLEALDDEAEKGTFAVGKKL